MESMKETFKGFAGKRFIERRQALLAQNKINRRLLIVIFFSFIILLALIAGTIIVPLVYNHHTNTESVTADSQAELTLLWFCSVTPHPDSCFTSISSIITPGPYKETDPDEFFVAYIRATIDEISSLATLAQTIASSANESVLENCTSSLSESASLLSKSLTVLGNDTWIFTWLVDQWKPLTSDEEGDLMTWLRGSRTNLTMCSNDLNTVGITAANELRAKVDKATVDASNIIDIFLNKEAMFRMFHPNVDNYTRVEFEGFCTFIALAAVVCFNFFFLFSFKHLM